MHMWPIQKLVIRIYFSQDHQVDWHVPVPDKVAFQDVIDVISQVSLEALGYRLLQSFLTHHGLTGSDFQLTFSVSTSY